MKSLRLSAALLLSFGLLAACNKSDGDATGPSSAKLNVSFSNEAGGQPVALGPLSYTNASGNKYGVDLLKYYVTNFTLVKGDGSERNFKTYNLIDASRPESLSFTLDSVANGDYTAVRFCLGVDSARNHTGAQDGALDPVNGMIWTWSTGYIFFKHEGNYVDASGATRPLVFHYGNDPSLVKVTVPLTKLTVSGKDRRLFLRFNLDSLYAAPNKIDFNSDNNRMSSQRDDFFWLAAMSANFGHAFQYVKAD